ncbi:MAG: discoidin domain-containing protein [Mobilitalea sp.]
MKKMSIYKLLRISFILLLVFACVPLVKTEAAGVQLPLKVTERTDWNNLFKRYSDWFAADGIFSVALDGNDALGSATGTTKTVLTFQDTFLGQVNTSTNQIISASMVNNTSAVLTGKTPDPSKIEFIWGDGGNKQSYSNLLREPGTFWINDGIVIGNNVHYLVMEISGLDAKGVRMLTVPISNGTVNWAGYTMTGNQSNLFYSRNGYSIIMGIGVLDNTGKDGYVYIYGYRMNPGGHKKLVVARTVKQDYSNTSTWTFWTGSAWRTGIVSADSSLAEIKENISTELSVTPITSGIYSGKYMLVYEKFVCSHTLEYAISSTPYGPFEEGVPFYTIPEPDTLTIEDTISYNAKAHPHLSDSGKLLVSYNVNRGLNLISDNNTYRPRFVELDLNQLAAQPALANVSVATAATCSSGIAAENPKKACDTGIGQYNAWVSEGTGTQWLEFDLGKVYRVERYRLDNAGLGGLSASYNTRDFKVQVSTDRQTWTDADTVTGNTASIVKRNFTPVNARFIRLYITNGTQPGADGKCRVNEFTVFGRAVDPQSVTPLPEPAAGTNVALYALADANGAKSQAPRAVDGKTSNWDNDKWCSLDAGDKWLSLDLGRTYHINRWVVKHAGYASENPAYNTRDYKLQMSRDGFTWVDVDSVTGNTANSTDRTLGGIYEARYVRLYITNAGSDGYSRIYELELYTANPSLPTTELPAAALPVARVPGGINVALNRTAHAIGISDSSASRAVDGKASNWDNDKWCSVYDSGDKWLSVDLGDYYNINRWVVKHAGYAGEDTAYNTRDFKLQKSLDGINWTDVDTVSGNTANATDRAVGTFTAKYVRLYITNATQSDSQVSRIYELEIYTAQPANAPAASIGAGTNVARNKTAHAIGLSESSASKAVDGNASNWDNDKWCSVYDYGDKWLSVDLGNYYNINRWVVKHASAAGESTAFNTSDFKLQASLDGINWIDVDIVSGNIAAITDRTVNPFTARYIRLYITKATQADNQVARIYELEVYSY